MKTILLDMYGVIIKESMGYFIPFVLQRFPKTEITYLKTQFSKAGLGEINSKELFESFGFNDWQAAQLRYLNGYLTLDREVLDFLKNYKNKCRIVLLSNDVADWNRYIMEKYGLNQYVDKVIVSANVGYRKPDKTIFEIALGEIKEEPSDCIFVDNSVANLHTAGELGIKPILFNRDHAEYNGLQVQSFMELGEVINNGKR